MILRLENEPLKIGNDSYVFSGSFFFDEVKNKVYMFSCKLWKEDISMENWGRYVSPIQFYNQIRNFAINHYENRKFRQPMFKR